jgi:spore germination cell wall hydrolase CwlJ-like protein
MHCNHKCNQGRQCNGCDGAPQPHWAWMTTWILVACWAFLMCWMLIGTAHAKMETYQQKVRCLSEVVYHEARGESYRGQLAVAQTVLNRVKSSRFPNHVCTVVFQKGQFSWTKTWNKSWNADRDSRQVARVALMGSHSMKDFKALYFHNTNVNPNWNRKRLATIGNHVFYL